MGKEKKMMLDDFLAMIPKEDKQRIDQQIDKLLMEQQRGKQTSIEWFASVTAQLGYVSMEILEQAMERHKEETMDAFQHGKWDWHEHLQQGTLSKDPAEYYNETFKGQEGKKEQPTFQDPYNLTDEEIDNLMIYSGTYKGEDASEETKAQWRKAYRDAEKDTNEQIQKAGGVEQWYDSGEGRLL